MATNTDLPEEAPKPVESREYASRTSKSFLIWYMQYRRKKRKSRAEPEE